MAGEARLENRSHAWKSQRCQYGHNLSWHDGNWNDPIPHIFRGANTGLEPKKNVSVLNLSL